jgi:sec-independent protein translocase protein TatC
MVADPSPQDAPEEEPGARMTFRAHLEELRGRVVRALLVLGALFLVGWFGFGDQLKVFFISPHLDAVESLAAADPPREVKRELQILSPLEDIFYTLKVSALSAALVGLPFLLYQVWAFVAAGLFKRERRAVMRFLPWALLFALAGMVFGYTFMIPTILEYLYAMPDQEYFSQGYRLSDYFSLFLMFTFALALIFQLPILMMGVSAAGLASASFFAKYRRHFILVAFVLGAMLTPPEPFSQLLMAAPTIVLYELGLYLVRLRERRAKGARA